MRNAQRVGVDLIAIALVVIACSTPAATSAPSAAGSASAASAPPAAAGSAVKIIDFGFDPASISVKVGATVTWTNTGATSHTVTADDGSFDSGSTAPGVAFSQAFSKAGTFAYHCNIHSSMHGTVVVTP